MRWQVHKGGRLCCAARGAAAGGPERPRASVQWRLVGEMVTW